MIHGIERPLNVRQDLIITRDVPPGVELRTDSDVAHGIIPKDIAQTLEACKDGLDVGGVGQPVGVDEGLVVGGGRGDGDGAAGLGGDVNGHEGGVLVAVGYAVAGGALKVADVAGEGEVFEFGPVGREGGEVYSSTWKIERKQLSTRMEGRRRGDCKKGVDYGLPTYLAGLAGKSSNGGPAGSSRTPQSLPQGLRGYRIVRY